MAQQKGIVKLMGLYYTIQYKKGADNRVADALSRCVEAPQEAQLQVVTMAVTPAWMLEVLLSYEGDLEVEKICVELVLSAGSHPHYSLHKWLLRYKGRLCNCGPGGHEGEASVAESRLRSGGTFRNLCYL